MKGGRRCAPSRAQLLGREPERATTMRLRFLAPLSRNRLKRFPTKLPKNGRRPNRTRWRRGTEVNYWACKSKVNRVRLLCLSLVHLELSLPFASRFPTCFLLLPLSGKTGEIFRWKHGKREAARKSC